MGDPIQYHIFSGRHALLTQELEKRNSAFQLWFQVWTEVFTELGSGALYADEFTRQDLIGAVFIGTEPAAVHLYSFFDIQCAASSKMKYFDYYSNSFWKKMKEHRDVRRVMSMEYFTVNPKFRTKNLGFNLGKAMTQAGCNLMKEIGLDAIIAPARQDYKVNELAYDLGFRCIESDVKQHGVLCDMIACFSGDARLSSDLSVARAGRDLWKNRVVSESAQKWLDRGEEIFESNRKAA